MEYSELEYRIPIFSNSYHLNNEALNQIMRFYYTSIKALYIHYLAIAISLFLIIVQVTHATHVSQPILTNDPSA